MRLQGLIILSLAIHAGYHMFEGRFFKYSINGCFFNEMYSSNFFHTADREWWRALLYLQKSVSLSFFQKDMGLNLKSS